MRQEWRVERKKAEMNPGPWQDEPDKVQTEWLGFPVLCVRGPAGSWCGYVGVSEGHPWFGRDYGDVDADVHGGLTFSNSCHEEAPEGEGVCHVPQPGESDKVWWLGFDCAHAWDLWSGIRKDWGQPHQSGHEHYWTVGEVEGECRKLAEQALVARGPL